MPRISIYEHSDTYSYQTRNLSYATVALPICAIWGPTYVPDDEDANPDWIHFTSGYRGTTDFVNTFKGPNVRMGSREKSYDYALKLLSMGYDVLVKRADNTGTAAQISFRNEARVMIEGTARYKGSYGNQLKCKLTVSNDLNTGTLQVYDNHGYYQRNGEIVSTDTLLETILFAFNVDYVTDTVVYINEVQTPYIGHLSRRTVNPLVAGTYVSTFGGGSDLGDPAGAVAYDVATKALLAERFGSDALLHNTFVAYMNDQLGDSTATPPVAGKATADKKKQIYNQQKVLSNVYHMLDELTDPLVYDWDCFFVATMDDQYIPSYWLVENNVITPIYSATKVHEKAAIVAAESKCGVAFFGTPFGMPKGSLTAEGVPTGGAVAFKNALSNALSNAGNAMYPTYAELVGPWCKSSLPTVGSNTWICPEMAHLSLIINSKGVNSINRWWMVPAGMDNAINLSQPEYKVKKHYLDIIQNHDVGVNLNPLMDVPGKGFTCFGNSTLWNKKQNTYNALQNLSTRLLANRVEQRIWDVSLLILFKYNNQDAYAHFYAGLSPLLDEMRAAGALTPNESNPWGYRIVMNPDIIDLDHINANTAIGKVYLAVTGVIDDVQVDLFLLPPNAFDMGLA